MAKAQSAATTETTTETVVGTTSTSVAVTTTTTKPSVTEASKAGFQERLDAVRRRRDTYKAVKQLIDVFYDAWPECTKLDDSFVDGIQYVVDHFPAEDNIDLKDMIVEAELYINVHGGIADPETGFDRPVQTIKPEWPESDDGFEGPVVPPAPKTLPKFNGGTTTGKAAKK